MKKILQPLFKNPIFIKFQSFILPVFSLLMSILLLIFLIIPQILEYISTTKIVNESQQKYASLSKKLITLQKADVTGLNDDISITYLALPKDKDIPGAINQILFYVSSFRLQLDGMAFSVSGADVLGVKGYPVKLDVSGDETSINQFIDNFKQAPRLMKIIDSELTANKSLGKAAASINLQVFYDALPSAVNTSNDQILLPTQQDKDILTKIKQNVQSVPTAIGPVPSSGASIKSGKPDPFAD